MSQKQTLFIENSLQITIVSIFPPSKNAKQLPNYHEIYLEVEDDGALQKKLAENMKTPGKTMTPGVAGLTNLISVITKQSDAVLNNNRLQALLKSGQKFDLVVFGWFFNDFQLGIAGHFRCPSVVVSTLPAVKPLRDFTGNPAGVSSVPFLASGRTLEPTTLWGRLLRYLAYVLEHICMNLANVLVYEPHYNMHFPASENYPSFDEVKRNVSLVLINHHFSQGVIRPHLPNMVEIGGIQIKDKADPLPKVCRSIFYFVFVLEHANYQ